MFEIQGRSTRKLIALALALLVLWGALSWLAAAYVTNKRIDKYVRAEQVFLDRQLLGIARDIDARLGMQLGVAELVARDERVIAFLSGEARHAVPRSGAQQAVLNRYLANLSASLASDVVWVLNDAGDCVAASNAHLSESFVGTHYSDRDYFQEMRTGKPGHQYAVGRRTDIPGVFFSVPVMLDGRFLGGVASKVDLPKLAPLVEQVNAFIVDENGVIILAHDKSQEMQSLPAAPVSLMSESVRLSRYKRADFPGLTLASWPDAAGLPLRRLGAQSEPVLLASRVLVSRDLEVYSYRKLSRYLDLKLEQNGIFLFLLLLGMLGVGSLCWKISHRHRQSQRQESAHLVRTIMESTSDGILVVDAYQKIVAFNQRFIEMWSVPPGLLAAGQIDALIAHVMQQADLSLNEVAKLADVLANPEVSGRGSVRLKDGRYIDCEAHSQKLGQRVIGRIWHFRDATPVSSVAPLPSNGNAVPE